MSFFDAIDLAASGLAAERLRMDVTSENLANAQTTNAANGQPYQRQEVVLQQVARRLWRPAGRRAAASPAHPGRRAGRGHRRRPDSRPARLRPGPPRRQRAGLREDAECQPRHRDDRPHLRVPAPTRRTSPRCRPPSRCTPRRWTSSSDSRDRSRRARQLDPSEWSVGSVGARRLRPTTSAAAGRRGAGGFGGALTRRDRLARPDPGPTPPSAAQALATGSPRDPDSRPSWRSRTRQLRCISPRRSATRSSRRPTRSSSTQV